MSETPTPIAIPAAILVSVTSIAALVVASGLIKKDIEIEKGRSK